LTFLLRVHCDGAPHHHAARYAAALLCFLPFAWHSLPTLRSAQSIFEPTQPKLSDALGHLQMLRLNTVNTK
jgi:hypothetical protein